MPDANISRKTAFFILSTAPFLQYRWYQHLELFRQIAEIDGCDDIPIADTFLVNENTSGVFHIVGHIAGAGYPSSFDNAGGDEHPLSVADRRDDDIILGCLAN